LAFLPEKISLKKLDGFVLKSFVGPMVLTFFIALFILVLQFVWKYVDDFVGKGFQWYIIMELLFYASLTFIPMALPLAVLLASLMTFGNLGENYELVAIKSSGISFRRAMFPLIIFIVVLSGCAFYFSNNILPIVNLKYGTLLFDVREKKPALNINEGMFYKELEGYVIRVGKKEQDGVSIRDVMIFDHTEGMGNNNMTVAESGKMETTPDKRFLIFTLFNGINYYEPNSDQGFTKTRPMQRTKFDEETRRIDLTELNMIRSKEDLFKDNYQMLDLHQLSLQKDTLIMELKTRQKEIADYLGRNFYYYSVMDSAKYDPKKNPRRLEDDFISNFEMKDQKEIVSIALNNARGVSQQVEYMSKELDVKNQIIAKFGIEWQRKFTLSFACLILFFIGAPLGAIIRKGGLGLPVVFSTLFFIVFHVISITGEKSAREGLLTPFEGMWLSCLIFLPIGILLTYSATTDSRILNVDWWFIMRDRLWTLFKKKFRSKKTVIPDEHSADL
jgi:lipopolysaccharide export system permease protein